MIDPANPITADGKGDSSGRARDGVSAGSVVSNLLSTGAHYVKAFGTVSAQSLSSQAERTPERAVLFYATDDDQAADVVERLISAAGFQPVKVGGVDQALRIEVFGELHDLGGQEGKLLEAERPHAALAASA